MQSRLVSNVVWRSQAMRAYDRWCCVRAARREVARKARARRLALRATLIQHR